MAMAPPDSTPRRGERSDDDTSLGDRNGDALPQSESGEDSGLLSAMPLNMRLPTIIAIGLGIIALMLTGWLGHLVMGLLICLGLALGIGNMWLVQLAVTRVTANDNPSKQRMAFSSASRLLIITAIAIVIGFLVKPRIDGIGVFVGLAVSQVLLVLTTTVPVLKGLRQQS